ncbi:efflux RND transporter permease subunit [Syntrophomonas erecta]
MKWVEFCLKHKYLIFSLVIATVLLGVYAKQNIPVDLFPDTAPPIVNVVTPCPGMSAEDIKDQVSEPMEEEFAALDGVKNTRSISQAGLSVVEVEFAYGVNIDSAAVDTQNAISHIKGSMPANIGEPRVQKFSTANRPIMTIGVSSSQLSPEAVYELVDGDIVNELQRVDGVAAVDIFGGIPAQVNIDIDRDKLEDLGISLQMVQAIIAQNNLTLPGGNYANNDDRYSLRIIKQADSIEEIKNLVIEDNPHRFITLEDVAEIKDSTATPTSIFRVNGEESLALQILKKDGANIIDVVKNIEDCLTELSQHYPALEFKIASSDATFTQQVVGNMTESVVEAMLLAAIVILLFLGSFIQSFIVAVAMPLTYLGTFATMQVMGIGLNLITLSALILSVGFVIDQTIVVVENIVRHRQALQEPPFLAALEGTKEVILPLAAGALTTIIVLIPLLFIKGFVGKIFGPLASTLIITLSVSFLVSTIIIPLFTVLVGYTSWSKGDKVLKLIAHPFLMTIDKLRGFYIKAVNWGLRHRKKTVGIAVSIMLVGVIMMRMLGVEALPRFDSGSFIINIQADPGSSLAKTSTVVSRIEQLLADEKNVVNYNTQIGYEIDSHFIGGSGVLGVNQATIEIELTSRKERNETIWEIQDRIRKKISRIPEIDTFVIKEEGATAVPTTTAPIDIQIVGSDTEVLNYLAGEVEKEIVAVPGVVNLYRNWYLNNPEIRIYPKSYAEYGLSTRSIANQVFQSTEDIPVSNLKSDRDLPVVVDYSIHNNYNWSDIENILLTTPSGQMIPLRAVANIEKEWGPSLISQENNRETIDILGFPHNRTFSFIIADIEKALDKIKVPNGYEIKIAGEQTDLQESSQDLKKALIMAIIGVYLVLLAQFRSFIYPLVIMLAIPLVVIGVALALLYSSKPVSMPVMLGFILLAGTVVNNSILLVDYTNRMREMGHSLKESLLKAINIRFRPIMMTAIAAIAGMLPLALEWSLGAERFSPLAISEIGGLATATLLTMIVIPVMYSIMDRRQSIKEVKGNDSTGNLTTGQCQESANS